MKLALTGATGFIGSRLLDLLPATGCDVRALTRRPMRPRRHVTWIDGSLDQPDALAELVKGTGAVIHIAGVISGRTATDFDHCNVDGTKALIDAAMAKGVERFVHVSSLAAREPSVSLYGASKARSEEVVRNSGLDYVIVRPPAVYGPGDKETLELFKWAKRGLAMLPPPGRLSIIHADDLAQLLLALASAQGISGTVLEPHDGADPLTHRDLASALGDAVGTKVRAISMPPAALKLGATFDQLFRGKDAKLTRDRAAYFCHPDWTSDPARAVPPSVWRPEIPLAQGLAQTAHWYRNQGWL